MYTGESKTGGSWTSSPKNKRGLFVFPSHEEKWNHSKNKLLEANEENLVAKITEVGKGFHAKSMTSDKADGLLPVVYICKGAKVMLTANLCVPYGLSNGSMGRVEEIIYKTGDSPKTSIPKVVICRVPKLHRTIIHQQQL
jgi:hypothetical protein